MVKTKSIPIFIFYSSLEVLLLSMFKITDALKFHWLNHWKQTFYDMNIPVFLFFFWTWTFVGNSRIYDDGLFRICMILYINLFDKNNHPLKNGQNLPYQSHKRLHPFISITIISCLILSDYRQLLVQIHSYRSFTPGFY